MTSYHAASTIHESLVRGAGVPVPARQRGPSLSSVSVLPARVLSEWAAVPHEAHDGVPSHRQGG